MVCLYPLSIFQIHVANGYQYSNAKGGKAPEIHTSRLLLSTESHHHHHKGKDIGPIFDKSMDKKDKDKDKEKHHKHKHHKHHKHHKKDKKGKKKGKKKNKNYPQLKPEIYYHDGPHYYDYYDDYYRDYLYNNRYNGPYYGRRGGFHEGSKWRQYLGAFYGDEDYADLASGFKAYMAGLGKGSGLRGRDKRKRAVLASIDKSSDDDADVPCTNPYHCNFSV